MRLRVLWELPELMCPECNAIVPAEARFCMSCGAQVGQKCPSCGHLNGARVPICDACGHTLGDRSHWGVERRQLSVIFCDLVGSTQLAERFDPEDWREILGLFHRVCGEALGFYQAHVAQYLGDGAMAYFGYPVAYEDDPIRAVRAALRILDGLGRANRELVSRFDVELEARLGIHTGEAIVGDVGPSGADDHLVMGSTMNFAARVQSVAPSGQVAISAATAALVEGYVELQSLGSPDLKGVSKRTEIFRVVGETGASTRLQAAGGGLAPFLGRAEELEHLQSAWRETVRGGHRAIVVRGEAGIGKSRLIERFKEGAGEEACRLTIRGSPLTASSAFAPVLEALGGPLRDRAEDSSPEALATALRGWLETLEGVDPSALPLLSELFGLPGGEAAAKLQLSLSARRQRILDSLQVVLHSLRGRASLLLTVEDLHWIDPSTLTLLEQLMRKGAGHVMLLMTARPRFESPAWSSLATTLEVKRLTEAEAEGLATQVAGRVLPLLVLRELIARAEGVPLFVEELTREVTRGSPDGAELAAVPASVHASLLARFDRLGPARLVAQLGATLGREFRVDLLRSLHDGSEESVESELGKLVDAGLVTPDGDAHGAYRFHHALVQETIYRTVPKKERRQLHERVFSALEQSFPEVFEARPEVAAYHATNAGLSARAVPLLLQVGQTALKRAAVHEAEGYLNRALRQLPELDEAERPKAELSIQGALAPAYMVSHGWASKEVEVAATRQRELGFALGDGQGIFAGTWGLYTVHAVRGDMHRALELGLEVEKLGFATSDPKFNLLGLQPVSYARLMRGEFEEALECVERGRTLFDLEREKQILASFQLSPYGTLLVVEVLARWILGQQDQSSKAFMTRLELQKDIDHPPTRANLMAVGGLAYHLAGQSDVLRAQMGELQALSRAEGLTLFWCFATVLRAWAEAKEGGIVVDAVRDLERGLAEYEGIGSALHITQLLAMHADVLLMAGRPDAARAAAEKALAQIAAGHERYLEPELIRLHALALHALGDAESARAEWRRALDTANTAGAQSLALRAAMTGLEIEPGPATRDQLEAVYDRFTEGLEKPDLVAARLLLS